MPSKQTIMNIQRKMRSITMATYFQSSFTCQAERGCEHEQRMQPPDCEEPLGLGDHLGLPLHPLCASR